MDYMNYVTRGFWGDEAWTTLISRLPVADLVRTTSEDFHPPLYYLIVHFWMKLFGTSEVAVRSVSAVAFLLTSLAVFMLAQKFWKDKFKSLVLSGLVLLSPILFTYGFEARAYAILTLLSVAGGFVFWVGKDSKNKIWRVLYFVFGAMSIYVHYYAWFILASHGLYLLLFERKRLMKMMAPALGIVLVQLPWIPTLMSQIGTVNNSYWIGAINERTHWEFFLRVTGGDAQNIYQAPVALLVLVALVMGFFFRLRAKKFDKKYLFLLTWLIVPTLIPSLISLKMPVFFYRYLIFSIVPILFLTIDAFSFLKKQAYYGFVLVLVVGFGLITWLKFSESPRSMREAMLDWESQGEKLDAPIYTVLPSFAETEYYLGLGGKYEVNVLPEGLIQSSGKSLLDTYESKDWTQVKEAGEDEEHWLFEPGSKVTLMNSEKEK